MTCAIIQIGDFSPNKDEKSPVDAIGDLVRAHIARTYRRIKGGNKLLAKHAGCSVNTAKVWYDGKGYPHGEQCARITAQSRVLQKQIQDRCERIRKEYGYDPIIDALYQA